MNSKYLGQEVHELILGEKINGFKSPHSKIERDHIIKAAQELIAKHPNEHIDFYHKSYINKYI